MNAHAKTIVPETHAGEAEAAKGVVPADAPATWAEVVAAFEAAVSDWKAKGHLHEDDHFAALGRKPTEDETEVGNAAVAALIRAEEAVLSYAPRSADEYGRKAALLLTHPEFETLEVQHILMEDAKRLAPAPAPDAVNAAIAALKAFEPSYRAAANAHDAAERALMSAAKVDVPPPDELVQITPSYTAVLAGMTAEVPESRHVFKTETAIKEAMVSEAHRTSMLAALVRWRAQIEAAELESGLIALREAERAADDAFQAALQRRAELGYQVLMAPVRTSAEVHRKLEAFASAWDASDWRGVPHQEEREHMLEALIRDIDLIGETPRGTQPTAMVRDRWETASRAYAEACDAARQDLDDEELSQREYHAFHDLRVALPPDFDALLAKCRLLIGDIGPKTFDDYLHEALDGHDECHLALIYQDLQHLLRCAGRPVPVEPMSFNLRLSMMGTIVRPDFLTEPSAEALEYISATGVDGLDQIRADAWIREYLEAGGTLHLGLPEKEFLYVGQPLPDTDERVRLREMIDVKHGDLRLAVVALAKERMQARGEVRLGVEA